VAGVEWHQVIAALIALYAAILATFTFVMNRREKRRPLKVIVSMGLPIRGPDVGDPQIFIRASNIGTRPITLNVPKLVLPSGDQLVLLRSSSDVDFPCELADGQSCAAWTDARELARQLKFEQRLGGQIKLVGVFEDSAAQTYRSTPYGFNVTEWAKAPPTA